MKMIKILTVASCVLLSSSVFAKKNTQIRDNDYDSGAYESEGNIIVKIRGGGILTSGQNTKLPSPTNSSAVKNEKFVKNGIILENANTLFFTDNIATELSVGISSYNSSISAPNSIYQNYGDRNKSSQLKKTRFIGFPITLTMQYHIAPFGGIRPYIGTGYNFTYFSSKSQSYKTNPSHGMAIQAGTDIVMTDDSVVNIDIRKFYGTSKITYKAGFLNMPNNVSSKVKLNPLTISVGIGFKI